MHNCNSLIHRLAFTWQEHMAQRERSCQIETANLEGSVKTKSIALNKIIALEEKVTSRRRRGNCFVCARARAHTQE